MTPREQAEVLFNKFYGVPLYKKAVKDCCLIAVNMILDEYHGPNPEDSWETERYLYWEQVKEEICKM